MNLEVTHLVEAGTTCLEKAILLVLIEAEKNGEALTATEITNRAGIFSEGGKDCTDAAGNTFSFPGFANGIVTGCLNKLILDKKVILKQEDNKKHWILADQR